MKSFILFIFSLTLTCISQVSYSNASVKVVANIKEDIQLSKKQVRNLFLGGSIDENLTAVALAPNNETRVLFNTKVVGLTEARIQSYWAQMKFSGRKKPPMQFENTDQAIDFALENDRAAIYLPIDAPVPDGLKVIFEVEN